MKVYVVKFFFLLIKRIYLVFLSFFFAWINKK